MYTVDLDFLIYQVECHSGEVGSCESGWWPCCPSRAAVITVQWESSGLPTTRQLTPAVCDRVIGMNPGGGSHCSDVTVPSPSAEASYFTGKLYWVYYGSCLEQRHQEAPGPGHRGSITPFGGRWLQWSASRYSMWRHTCLDWDMARSKFNEVQLTARCHGSDYLIWHTERGSGRVQTERPLKTTHDGDKALGFLIQWAGTRWRKQCGQDRVLV